MLRAQLAQALPEWRPSAAVGGLHLMVVMPDHVDEASLLTAAARHGVGIEGLSLHSYTGDCPPGLVLGHAYLPAPAIHRGLQLLAQANKATAT
jgi:GntR family transcriptional regulator/MocR family aminotransferase